MRPLVSAPLLVVVVLLYAAGVAWIWYGLTEEWERMAAVGVPLSLVAGFAVGRLWAPLLAAVVMPIALPDAEGGVEGAPAWLFSALFVGLPSAVVILIGVVLRAALEGRSSASRT